MAAAHDATVTVAGPGGTRDIPFADFPVAFMTPALEPNELLTTVKFPRWPAGHGYGFVEFARRHGDFAIASAAALLEMDASGKVKRASLTLGGVTVGPIRVKEVEKALVGQAPSEDLFRQLCEECRKVDAIDDVHAPASYRQHLAAVMSRRALVAALSRVGRV
jgi:carbon-monoxide dehydrogenase medium subunit